MVVVMASSTQAPTPPSLAVLSYRLRLSSEACLILFCSSPISFFLLFPPLHCHEYPFPRPIFPISPTLSVFPFLLSSSCPFELVLLHCILPQTTSTQSSSLRQWFDKKLEEPSKEENVPAIYMGLHCMYCSDRSERHSYEQASYRLLILLFPTCSVKHSQMRCRQTTPQSAWNKNWHHTGCKDANTKLLITWKVLEPVIWPTTQHRQMHRCSAEMIVSLNVVHALEMILVTFWRSSGLVTLNYKQKRSTL